MESQGIKAIRIFRFIVIGFVALATLMFGFLALGTVPAPNEHIAMDVSGTVVKLSQPHPEYGDLTIMLDGGRRYYVNRANEIDYIAWEQLLEEVHPGDTLYLTIVNPLAWRLFNATDPQQGPVAGIRTDTHVYMDPQIAASTWTAQASFSQIALISLAALIIALIWRPVREHHPMKPENAGIGG